MKERKDDRIEDVAHYAAPPFLAPGLGDSPPSGARIAGEVVCRDCMTAAEEIAMRRGFADAVSAEEARAAALACARCGRPLVPGG